MSLHVTRDSLKRYQGQTAALNITQKHRVNQQPDQNANSPYWLQYISSMLVLRISFVELQQAQVL